MTYGLPKITDALLKNAFKLLELTYIVIISLFPV